MTDRQWEAVRAWATRVRQLLRGDTTLSIAESEDRSPAIVDYRGSSGGSGQILVEPDGTKISTTTGQVVA